MKRSGRTLKQRLYDLKHLPSRIRRARHFRGHGVHSPFVYGVVRQVFMRSTLIAEETPLYEALRGVDVAEKRAVQLQNLATHCGVEQWSIDDIKDGDGLVVVSLDTTYDHLEQYASKARESGAILCIMSPYYNAQRWEVCRKIVEQHCSTVVDNRAYLLLFNNHLPRQHYRL